MCSVGGDNQICCLRMSPAATACRGGLCHDCDPGGLSLRALPAAAASTAAVATVAAAAALSVAEHTGFNVIKAPGKHMAGQQAPSSWAGHRATQGHSVTLAAVTWIVMQPGLSNSKQVYSLG